MDTDSQTHGGVLIKLDGALEVYAAARTRDTFLYNRTQRQCQQRVRQGN